MDLYIAAGGGADVVSTAMVQCAAGHAGDPILCYSWDRLIYDPRPGPRLPSDFRGLERQGSLNYRVTPSSTVAPPGRSTLPRLAQELRSPLLLLDPGGGAVGMGHQVHELVELLRPDAIHIVDVGGDVVAEGGEPNLRSPVADSLVLAATADLSCPTDVLVAGPGLDGELSEDEVLTRCSTLSSGDSLFLRLSASHVAWLAETMKWLPSEAGALLWAAAMGLRGAAEIRDHASLVVLTDHSAEVHRLDRHPVLEGNRLASAVLKTSSLEEAETGIKKAGGRSEVDVERTKAEGRRNRLRTLLDTEALRRCLDALDDDAGRRGVAFVTIRRIAEQLGLTTPDLDELVAKLREFQPARCQPPLWLLRQPVQPTANGLSSDGRS